MSPASQGTLEVERYIGSCLISSGCCKQQDQQQQQQQHRTTSKQNQFWPTMQQQQAHNRVPLSRLAVHTQGAPLILSSQRYHNNRQIKQQPPPLFNNLSRAPPIPQHLQQQRIINNNNKINAPELKKTLQQQQQQQQAVTKPSETNVNGTTVASIDSLSIASDESSGSNNSENSLPRIIKPRKRRKKDRKPTQAQQQQQQQVNNPTTTSKDNNNKVVEETTLVPSIVVQQTTVQPNSTQQQIEQPRLRSYDNNLRYNNNDNYYRRSMNNANRAPNNLPPAIKPQEVIDTRQQQQQQQQRFAHRHVQVKVLDDNRNVIMPVALCQAAKANNYLRQQQQNNNTNNSVSSGNNRYLHNDPTINCHSQQDVCNDECVQCRYCDPATLIWDVADQASFPTAQYLTQAAPIVDLNHRRQHQHHHHHHHHRYAQVPVFLTARPIICQEHANGIEFFDIAAANASNADNPCSLRLRPASNDRVDGAALLRRSWSDPTSYFSDEIVMPNRDVGVIGDRGGGDSMAKVKNPWRGDALSVGSNSPIDQPSSPTNSSDSNCAGSPTLQGPLEVSTEIVTSPNGHRDLEIKFYSSSPTYSPQYYTNNADERLMTSATFAFPDDDDNEEFSDIWSYHESKLQQDFRTLLQAGED